MPSDIRGMQIDVGDKVVFGLAQTKNQAIGTVVKICDKTVGINYEIIRYHYWSGTPHTIKHSCLREFHNVVVVEKQQ